MANELGPNSPVVSVLCLSYNQEEFIKQCLDSIISQKTNFPFEILVNDDVSTDNTRRILTDYKKKYPNIVGLVLQEENQYSRGVRSFYLRYLIPKAKGKYIALCDGDDYWTDSNKLQLQVDFLEKNPDYSICFHPVRVIFENKNNKEYIYPEDNNSQKFTADELLKRNFIQTNSVVYRKQSNYKGLANNVMPGDWFLHLYHARFGKIGFIDKTMGVYRRHADGIWWDSYKNKKKFWDTHGLAHLNMFKALREFYRDPVHTQTIDESMFRIISDIFDANKQNAVDSKIFREILREFPDTIIKFISFQNSELEKKQEYIANREDTVENLKKEVTQKDKSIEDLEKELNRIRSSYAYKAYRALKKQKRHRP